MSKANYDACVNVRSEIDELRRYLRLRYVAGTPCLSVSGRKYRRKEYILHNLASTTDATHLDMLILLHVLALEVDDGGVPVIVDRLYFHS